MKQIIALSLVALTAPFAAADGISLQSAPPVVVKTLPTAGATNVNPSLVEIQVTYSKRMRDGSWSWSTWGEENYPETTGKPKYLSDGRTCVLPVKLKPGKFYALWLNSEKFKNFEDASGIPAVPYLLTFETDGSPDSKATSRATANPGAVDSRLKEDQRRVLEWTDRQFRGFFEMRTFDGWPAPERANLETRLLDTLKGPHTREYYQAINSLGALRSQKAVAPLLAIAADRAEKDNRDRWMAIRSLDLVGDKSVVPELIHLVYHGNANTRWWAQISLVRLTGQNFGNDWKAWGNWWNAQKGQPPFKPELIRWWSAQAEPDKLADSLEEADRKFFEKLNAPAGTPPPVPTK